MPLNMQNGLLTLYTCRRKSCLLEMEGEYFNEKELRDFSSAPYDY